MHTSSLKCRIAFGMARRGMNDECLRPGSDSFHRGSAYTRRFNMPPAADDVSTAHEHRYNKSPVYASEPIERHGLSKVQQFRYHATCKHPAATRAGEARGYLPHTILENFVRSVSSSIVFVKWISATAAANACERLGGRIFTYSSESLEYVKKRGGGGL